MPLISQISTDKRFVMGCITLLLTCFAKATTYEVSSDGNYDFTSIQEAIDIAVDNDTILVHPGTFHENISIYSKNISLQSTYYLTDNPEDIENTRILGTELLTTASIEDCFNLIIQGFTISNSNYSHPTINQVYGGGVYVSNSNLELLDCTITECVSYVAGGLYVHAGTDIFLSNVSIMENQALYGVGGAAFLDSQVTFDSFSRCSIYGNYSNLIMDLCFSNCNHLQNYSLNVYLNFASSSNSNSEYYIKTYEMEAANIVLNQALYNNITQDIFVSTQGDNNNTGLTVNEPIQSIAKAVNMVDDLAESVTLHINPGIYRRSENNQNFPFRMKSNINICGSGLECTIIDLENCGGMTLLDSLKNISFTDISIVNGFMFDSKSLINVEKSQDILFENVRFSNCSMRNAGNIIAMHCDNVQLINVDMTNINSDYNTYGLLTNDSSIIIDNCHFEDLTAYGTNRLIPLVFLNSNLIMNNSYIINCYDYTGRTFNYVNYPEYDNRCIINNSLIAHNAAYNSEGSDHTIYIANGANQSIINSSTFAHNYTADEVVVLYGDFLIRNSILSNPNLHREIQFGIQGQNNCHILDIDFCCIADGLDTIYTFDGNTLNCGSNNIFGNPLFFGGTDYSVLDDSPEYYRLSPSSLCIDAGTPDTLGLGIPPTDLDGAARIWNGVIDIGCYEYNSVPNNDETQPQVTNQIKLYNYPNPVDIAHSNPYTFIDFQLPNKQTEVPEISIYNIKGQLVRTLKVGKSREEMIKNAGLEQSKSSNSYSVTWNCRDNNGNRVASGIYFYKLTIESESVVKKMMLVK